jgi:DMSO/TMAO reductase YedYZ molybdopterin-dependent catalytic subunit
MAFASSSRRDVLKAGLGSLAGGLAAMSLPGFAFPGQQEGEIPVPFLDMPPASPNRLAWEKLHDWLTPQDQVFSVQHYGIPEVSADDYRLEIAGLVDRPQVLTLEQIRSRPHAEQLMTLECSGNGASKRFMDAVYNSQWTGTLLGPLLEECGVRPEAKEIVFYAHDQQEETLRKGTNQELAIDVAFGRSMSVEDAAKIPLLLAYERNGALLEARNGAPLRLIAPGWYGIASVKWLRRIELSDRRYMGRFMARDYVTVRGERRGYEIVHVEQSVTRMNLKSVIARVTRGKTSGGLIPLRAYGAVWSDGTEIDKVEVQVDQGPWKAAALDAQPRATYCWIFFSIDLGSVEPGKHLVVSRAIDVRGRIQPSAEDDEIALKKTYWEAYQQWPRAIEITA